VHRNSTFELDILADDKETKPKWIVKHSEVWCLTPYAVSSPINFAAYSLKLLDILKLLWTVNFGDFI